MKYVIVGNGVAGTEAALAVRKYDADGDITILSGSGHYLYYRPRLIDYLAGKAELEAFTLYKEAVYHEKNIVVNRGCDIMDVDPNRKIVTDAAGGTYAYDKLLLATGARCFMPPVPGLDLPGVFAVRGVEDCDRLRAHCTGSKRTVVLGGGLLGLEVANSLLALGQGVTVVEACEWLLPRQLDETAGRLIQGMLEERGITFKLGVMAGEVMGDTAVCGVRLNSGRDVPADTVVVSAGIRGRDALARKAGVDIGRGVVVDDFLQTSVSDIYAAGDPVEHRGNLYGIWPAAREQGIAAGANMAGHETVYEGTGFSTALKAAGIALFSAGDISDNNAEEDIRQGPGFYRKLLIKDNRLAGAMVVGETASVPAIRKAYAGAITIDELKAQLS